MGTRPRDKPERLAEKLLAIRQELEASQSEMAALLGYYRTPSRVSECEHGHREPNLLVLLNYAKLARVRVEVLIDDKHGSAEKIPKMRLARKVQTLHDKSEFLATSRAKPL